jgi:hypothetical protein
MYISVYTRVLLHSFLSATGPSGRDTRLRVGPPRPAARHGVQGVCTHVCTQFVRTHARMHVCMHVHEAFCLCCRTAMRCVGVTAAVCRAGRPTSCDAIVYCVIGHRVIIFLQWRAVLRIRVVRYTVTVASRSSPCGVGARCMGGFPRQASDSACPPLVGCLSNTLPSPTLLIWPSGQTRKKCIRAVLCICG